MNRQPSTRDGAEAAAAASLVFLATPGVAGYLLDNLGFSFAPGMLLGLTLLTSATTLGWLGRTAVWRGSTLTMWGGVVALVFGWLVWIARPDFVPLGTGTDLTHHLQLIRFIEDRWHLPHDVIDGDFLGEMLVYTPASHILVAAAGRWIGLDGTRVLHGVLALVAALEAGLVLLIARRLLPARVPPVLALLAPIGLFAMPAYVLGPFIDFSFVAQVVAGLFAVAMWWRLMVWQDEHDIASMVLFAIAGVATFLSWPILIGPPLVALGLVMVFDGRTTIAARARHAAVAMAPMVAVAAVYAWHRTQFLRIAGAAGEATGPAVAVFGWPLLLFAAIGCGLVLRSKRRAVVWLVVGIAAQSVALYVFATSNNNQPYMALKTLYLLAYPMSVLAAIALGRLWQMVVSSRPAGMGERGWIPQLAAWVLVIAAGWMVGRPLVAAPKILRMRPPAVSLPLYEAGTWVRTHLPPACVEYLVGNDNRAYWLHLGVLGNRRLSARSANPQSFEPQDALVRWLSPGSLPYAIAELPALPRGIREDFDIVQSFGTAAVVRHRSPAPCNAAP
jgi:hypothetical protein